ncbi:hypothetical protein MRB53_038128 [Persea americana]|nr:hypothetical protein MRB53_038128 [Persea americana]
MVSCTGVSGLSAAVVVDGKALDEYRDPEIIESNSSATCFIEAQSGVSFEVRLSLALGFNISWYNLMYELFVDGHKMKASVCSNVDVHAAIARSQSHTIREIECSSSQQDKVIKRPLLFAPLTMTHGTLQTSDRVEHDLCTIVVKCWRVLSSLADGAAKIQCEAEAYREKTIDEKALKGKALSHSVRYDDEEPPHRSC